MVDLLIENYRCQTGKSIIGEPGATDPLQVEIGISPKNRASRYSLYMYLYLRCGRKKKSTNDVKGMRSVTCSDCSFFLHACLEARESFTAKVL